MTQLTPELLEAFSTLKSLGLAGPDPLTTPIGDVRAAHSNIGAYLSSKIRPVAIEEEFDIPVGTTRIRARFYAEHSAQPRPLMVYFHGGGFAYGTAAGWDGFAREVVRDSGIGVLNVDYRLAPEHRFPAAYDDARAALTFAFENAAALGVDVHRVGAGGDSAGANLALAAACNLHREGPHKLKHLLLIYGVFSTDIDSDSWRTLGTGAFGLSRAQMDWVWSTYLMSPDMRTDPRASPLSGDLGSCPAVFQIVGSLDPLLDDARRLSAALDRLRISNRLEIYPGMNHGFVRLHPILAQGRRAIADIRASLRCELAGGAS